MKNQISQFLLVIIAFVAITFLMSYTRPAAEEPKQYIVVSGSLAGTKDKERANFEKAVSDKLAEGWRLQGGVCGYPYTQAMVK